MCFCLPLILCGHGLSPVVYGSDDPQLVLQRVMRVEQDSVFFSVYCTGPRLFYTRAVSNVTISWTEEEEALAQPDNS